MADEKLTVDIEATDNASGDLKGVATGVSRLTETLDTAVKALQSASRQSNALEKSIAGVGSSTLSTTANIKSQTSAIQAQAAAAKSAAGQLRHLGGVHTPGTAASRVGSAPTGTVVTGAERASREASENARAHAVKIAQQQQRAIMEVVKANVAETQAWRAKNSAVADAAKITGTYSGSAAEVASRMQDTARTTAATAQSATEMSDSMFTARFALHDISNTAGIAGAALVGMAAAGVSAAMQYETAMASIERTSGASRTQMAEIRNEFIDLAQSVPAGFEEMAQIGELAGQLNIASGNISDFTRTVAMFTSSTDVAVQQSAEAFGRLDALLPDVRGNYEALGSSILNVGVNSVATESAIVSTTTQIAAAGAQAGLTSGEIIGLAASYASLGVAPEASRGSTIRIFSEIRSAVLEGGAALDTFASLSSMTADEFQTSWGQNPGDTLMSFLEGLQREGPNAETVLRNLGITGVRDINALLRLSQNLDIVSENFGYAIDGFQDGTALVSAFGITSETLASRLQVLAQTVQALFASLGESSTGPLKVLVDMLISFGTMLTDVINNPLGQAIALFGGLSAVLGGGLLLIVSMVARVGALGVALRITQRELQNIIPGARGAGAAVAGAGTAAQTGSRGFLAAAAGALTLRNALRAIAATTVIGAALTAVVMGIQAVGEASQTSGDRLRERFGDMSGLTNALKKDTRELADDAGSAIGSFTVEVENVTEKHSGWSQAMQDSGLAASSLEGSVERVSSGLEEQTFLIGENTQAWWANALANDESTKKMYQAIVDFNNAYGTNIDPSGLIRAQIAGDSEAIQSEMDAIYDKIWAAQSATVSAMASTSDDALRSTEDALNTFMTVEKALGELESAYSEATGDMEYLTALGDAIGFDYFAEGADAADEFADSTEDAAQALRNATEASFGMENAMGGVVNAADALFNGLANSVDGFNALSVDGQNNLSNLQTAIVQSITAGEAMGLSAADSVAALFVELERRGIETANLLSSLANIPGIGIKGVTQIRDTIAGSRGLAPAAENLSTAFKNVGTSARKASRGTGGAGRAAKQATKEVRTLTDYASDLSKVWSRAFEIRYSGSQGIDNITTSWREMSEAIAEARREYEEIQRKIAELNTDKNTLLYFQQVAVDYGDALRAAEIADKLAENNAKLAEENRNAAEAQALMDRSLKGNSKAAIENRAQLLDLVEEYQSYMQSLAASGMSQADLQAKSQELRNEFVQQAVRMGYNRNEVEKYAVSFDDMTTAINRVPRNITVQANANPAIQALKEFEAQAKKASSAAGGIGRSLSNGFSGSAAALTPMANRLEGMAKYASAMGQVQSSLAWLVRDTLSNPRAIPSHLSSIKYWTGYANGIRRQYGFKSGGYTGGGGVNDVAGVVHGKEYVINAENTSRLGLDFLNALNSGKTPAAPMPGLGGTQVVELSAFDRQLLANAGNVSLAIDGRVIADASNAANFVSTKRGSN